MNTADDTTVRTTHQLTWRLRTMMAERQIRSAAELSRRLKEVGYHVTGSNLTRFINERPLVIKTAALDALLEVLQCGIEDLLKLEPVDSTAAKPKKAKSAPRARKPSPKGENVKAISRPSFAVVPGSSTSDKK